MLKMCPLPQSFQRTVVPQFVFETLRTKTRFEKRRGFLRSECGSQHSSFYCSINEHINSSETSFVRKRQTVQNKNTLFKNNVDYRITAQVVTNKKCPLRYGRGRGGTLLCTCFSSYKFLIFRLRIIRYTLYKLPNVRACLPPNEQFIKQCFDVFVQKLSILLGTFNARNLTNYRQSYRHVYCTLHQRSHTVQFNLLP